MKWLQQATLTMSFAGSQLTAGIGADGSADRFSSPMFLHRTQLTCMIILHSRGLENLLLVA